MRAGSHRYHRDDHSTNVGRSSRCHRSPSARVEPGEGTASPVTGPTWNSSQSSPIVSGSTIGPSIGHCGSGTEKGRPPGN